MTEHHTEADWLHLKPYGYAPGRYTKKCLFCDSIMRDVDKAATKCRYCAEQKYAEASAAPPAAPQTEAERLAQALEGPGLLDYLTLRCAAAELRRLSADARMLDWIACNPGFSSCVVIDAPHDGESPTAKRSAKRSLKQ